MKRQRTALPTDPAQTNNRTDEISTIVRYTRASALTPSEETKLIRRAVLENNHASDPCQIRGPSAREALERLFARHHNIILATGVPSVTDVTDRRAAEPRFRSTLLTAALLAPVLCPFYRNRSSIDFLHPNGLLRARDDRDFIDAILIMNKTCASTLVGRTMSLIPFIQGIAGRLGATLQAHRSEATLGGPRAPTDTATGLATRWSVAYDSPTTLKGTESCITYRILCPTSKTYPPS